MTNWTALLESLHSALIDELTDRHPEPKPTLGMPIRQKVFSPPQASTHLLIIETTFEGTPPGFALMAFETPFMEKLKVTPEEFWSAILKRAGTEFMRRNIRPKIGTLYKCPKDSLPKGFTAPERIIWIPFVIPSGQCHLGLGV